MTVRTTLSGAPEGISASISTDTVTFAPSNPLRCCTTALAFAQQALDDTTRNLFEHLLKWNQEHVDHLERELGLIAKLGEAGYFAARMQ